MPSLKYVVINGSLSGLFITHQVPKLMYTSNMISVKVKVMCKKFECRKDIHYKTQTRTSWEKCNSKAFRLGIEPASSGLLDQCSTTSALPVLTRPVITRPVLYQILLLTWSVFTKVQVQILLESTVSVFTSDWQISSCIMIWQV